MTFDRGSEARLETFDGDQSQEDTGSLRWSTPAVYTSARSRAREGDGVRSVRLAHTVVSVREARLTLVQDLRERQVPTEVIDEAESVVAELVGNAVRHARPLSDGCVRIRWKVKAGAVEVEVRDGGGETAPQPARPSPWAPRGRGLRIVRSMAHEWGVQQETNGRTVWAALGGPSRRRAG